VVGPNGSGKSNVVDALAWVMGEQGPKTLRGGKMEDVIFAGTETRGPLGRAEVQLTIDNTDGTLPIEYTEVTISRTLFRNGGSEYAINGEPCRLLDVQELLSDTGLGREMHVIVGQGQLDNVLRATPIERRAFIEEAAGILKYRRRKEKTERKLEAMQANLTRLNDLAAELRRQLRPLGRQAEVAKQAQHIAAEARAAKGALLSHQVRQLRAELELTAKSEAERRTEAGYLEQQLAANRQTISTLEADLMAPGLDDLRNQLHSLERTEQRIRSALNLVEQRVTLLQSPVGGEVENVSELTAELAALEATVAELEQQQGQHREQLTQLESARELHSKALGDFDADALRERVELEQAQRELSRLQSVHELAQSRVTDNLSQHQRLAAAAAEISERISSLESTHFDLATELDAVSDSGLRAEVESAGSLQNKLAAEVEQLRDQLHGLERQRDAVAARHAALNLTLDQGDGAKAVASARLTGVSGLLADSLSVEPGYETAIAVALGTLADAVRVKSRADAVAALTYLKREGLGRADFVIATGKAERRPRREQAGLVAADSVLEAPGEVLELLSEIYIAENLESAQRALDQGVMATVITLDGDFLAGSLVRGGGTKPPSTLELVSERDASAKELGKLAADISQLSDSLQTRRVELTQAEQATKLAVTKLQELDAELGARAERAGRTLATLEAARGELARVLRDQETAAAALQLTQVQLAEAETALAAVSHPEAPTERSPERESLVAELERARTAELELKVTAASASERLRSQAAELARLRGRIAEAKAAEQRLGERELARARDLSQAEVARAELPQILQLCEQLSGTARLKLRELEAERSQLSERLLTLRAGSETLLAKQNELNRNVHEVELRNHELRLNLQNLEDRVREELSVSLDQLLADNATDDRPRDQLERELRSAEARLSQLGQFNPLALEEFAALEQRHKYLSDQLEDLARARADLLGIIKDLDGKMQTIFDSAFSDTARAFETVFPMLFPGGSGSLSLTDPENLLETGVEVAVRPAGKRIERMSLLSGGERSLAAVALLIAIFKARPSPFYVLDEVEAALDDANLGRLLSVINDLRSSSQLIIVTHQKRTMEIADSLYGVSMNRDGMSAVVGQRLERAS
jgi:chromosome segregation protein